MTHEIITTHCNTETGTTQADEGLTFVWAKGTNRPFGKWFTAQGLDVLASSLIRNAKWLEPAMTKHLVSCAANNQEVNLPRKDPSK